MKKRFIQKWSAYTLVLSQIIFTAITPFPVKANLFGDLQLEVVSDHELDSMRGGYAPAERVEVSFGIKKAVFIDGLLQVVTNFNISSANSVLQQNVSGQNVSLAPTSSGNILQSDFSRLSSGVLDSIRDRLDNLIQNSDDSRVINSITFINASISSRVSFSELNFYNLLQSQQVDAL